jgi:CTP:molybdopterin cytidylyltransferase MocA
MMQESERPQLIGILLAAGRGRRMGGSKQLLLWPADKGDKPLVAAAFDAVAGVCDHMIVVLGHEADAVAAALGDRMFHPAESDADAEMFESIRIGLRAAQQIDPAADALLHPADHPEVAPATLSRLIDALNRESDRAVMPEHDGRGGHPVLIPSGLTENLLHCSGEGGLRQYWIDHPEQCARLVVDDASVVRDLDTPEDLERDKRNRR